MGRPGLSLDKKFRRLAHDLDDFQAGFGRVLARGSLELLWDTAYESCTDELGDAFDVEAAAEWRGTGGRLVKALLDAGGPGNAGFIEEGGSPFWPEGATGTYRVHDLWDHAPEYARKRVAREDEREKKGKTIKEMRAEAGRKGAAKTNAKRTANGQPQSSKGPATVATHADQGAANVRQFDRTPAPAPAPGSATTRAEPDPAEAKWPLIAAALAALWERKVDALWPAEADTCDRLERAITAVTLPVAIDCLAASLAADPAHPWLGWHIEALKPKPKRTHGDLGAELRPWPSRLTDEDRPKAWAEWQEIQRLDPDFADAPLGITGVESSPAYEAICAFNAKWRAIAEARTA